MSIRFATLAKAVAHSTYKPNEDVWIGGGATLGDEVSGYYVFRRDADTPAGPGVIVVPNGRLERTSDPNAQFDALAVRTAERLRPDLDDLDTRIGAMELTLSNALINLPAQVAEHLKSGDPLSIAGEVTATGAATAAEINSTLKGSPQPIEGQVALLADVVDAIGSAVNAAIRGGGALPEPSFGPDTAGTITTGGTAQQVLAAAGSPRDVLLTNDSTGDLRVWVGTGNPSATAGRLLYPGGSFTTRTAERVAIWGATTGQQFTYSVGVA